MTKRQEMESFIKGFVQNHSQIIPNDSLNRVYNEFKRLESQFKQKTSEPSIEPNDKPDSITCGSNRDFNEVLKKSFNEPIEGNTIQQVTGGSIGFPINDPNSIERKKCTIVRDFMVGKDRMKEERSLEGNQLNGLKNNRQDGLESTSESVSGCLTIKLFVNGNVENGVCKLSLEGLETESKPNGIKKYEKRIEGYVHAFDETDEE